MEDFTPQHYPTRPGVYLMHGDDDAVLYVGKAKNLRSRLRSYFSAAGDGRAHIRFLLNRATRIETIVTDTEKEALILENTLIKKYRPRYNISLRDDKTYVSLRLDLHEEFPTLQVVRRVKRDGALYFGPYSSASAVKETLKEIYRIFPLRHYPLQTCRRRGRPCLFYQIGQCSGPCHGRITAEGYRELVQGVVALLSGREREAIDLVRQRMTDAAAAMRFEEAARLRDQVRAMEQTVEKQKVVDAGGGDMDVAGLYRDGGEVELTLLFIRQGKLIGRRNFTLEWRLGDDELLAAFLQQYYGGDVLIPDRVLLPLAIDSADVLADWLTERRGKKATVAVPQRGGRLELIRLAENNAQESFRARGRRREALHSVLGEIRERLHLSRLPERIECFDISNIQGNLSVGSMAVLLGGEPTPAEYRHYRIRSVVGADDYASLREILLRRLQRGLDEEQLPDMLLIDGGKGQLAVAVAVLEELGLTSRIDCAGIAKSRVLSNVRGKVVERSEERFFRPGRKNPVTLRHGSPSLHMLEGLRDEAHRFAITYHRKLRSKRTLQSGLEKIPGVGPARRKVLLKHFGSLKRIQQASLEDLEQAPGVPKNLARTIYEHLHS